MNVESALEGKGMNLERVCVITGLLVLVLVLVIGGGTSASDPPDPFLSYQIKKSRGEPPFESRNVFLADRFGEGEFRVRKPVALLNPADVDGEGITDPETHLISYRIRGPRFDLPENVSVEDRFGQHLLKLKRANRLLVPASKNLSAPPDAPVIADIDLDHFLCYPVRKPHGPHGDDDDDDDDNDDDNDDDDDDSGDPIQISVVDQFNQPKLFDVKRPTRLCNRVTAGRYRKRWRCGCPGGAISSCSKKASRTWWQTETA